VNDVGSRSAAARRNRRRKHRSKAALVTISFVVGAIYFIPLIWVLSMSVRSAAEILEPGFVPESFRPRNYGDAWKRYELGKLFRNTGIVTAGTVCLGVALSVTAAYGFSLVKSRFGEFAFTILLLGLMVPPAAVIIPFFIGMRELGLYDSLLAVILAETVFVLPLGVLILRAYIESIPKDLSDAARIDGASEWSVFASIVFPLIRPAAATVALFMFLSAWNGFLLPLVLIRDPGKTTLTLGLSQFSGQLGSFEWHLIAAASAIAVVPVLVVFYLARRYYVQGLAAGALKQ
jgi:ABC-type glycerol-3-phosphate transport system permease component